MTMKGYAIYSVDELLKGKVKVEEKVCVRGWVRTRRDSKAGLSFIALSDGSCFKNIQIIAPQNLSNYANEVLRLTAGCSIAAEGKLVASPGKGQAVEVAAENIHVYGFVEDPDTYPISPKAHTLEYLREHLHLRSRTNIIGASMRVSHAASLAVHRFFDENGFYWIHTPIITSNDCEGAGEMFRVSKLNLEKLPKKPDGTVDFSQDYFGKETFLTVSGQLNVETYCEALSRVYTFGPTFRAEESNTNRHLSEFWMIEPEIAFADLKENAQWVERMLKYVFKYVLEKCPDDMAFFDEQVEKGCVKRLETLVESSFAHMDYTDAIKILEKSGKKFEFPVSWGINLQSEHERFLAEEHVKGPVVVMNYPKDIKAFYMRQNEDGKTVSAMDVLVPGIGEITGGSQREERYDVLVARMKELKMDLSIYQWYLDLRRYGSVPHSGYGTGFERMLRYMTGMQSIRDVIPFPRYPGHAIG